MAWFDPVAMTFLNRQCEQYEMKLVISSTWRMGSSNPSRFHELFAAYPGMVRGLHREWRTDELSGVRGLEIQKWLDEHDNPEYIILDDDSDMLESQIPSFVHTDTHEGMLSNHYRRFNELMDNGEFRG